MHSRRRVLSLAAWLLSLILTACGPAAVDTPPPLTSPGDVPTEIRDLEQEIAERVNQQREENGVDPLGTRDDLAAVAREYSQRMLDEGFFDHIDPAGGDVADRVRDAGISFVAVGENLYLGQGPVDHVQASVDGWMQSPGHRENILRDLFTQTGVGMARNGNDVRVTQVFLTPGP